MQKTNHFDQIDLLLVDTDLNARQGVRTILSNNGFSGVTLGTELARECVKRSPCGCRTLFFAVLNSLMAILCNSFATFVTTGLVIIHGADPDNT